jgi:hypothetical protein
MRIDDYPIQYFSAFPRNAKLQLCPSPDCIDFKYFKYIGRTDSFYFLPILGKRSVFYELRESIEHGTSGRVYTKNQLKKRLSRPSLNWSNYKMKDSNTFKYSLKNCFSEGVPHFICFSYFDDFIRAGMEIYMSLSDTSFKFSVTSPCGKGIVSVNKIFNEQFRGCYEVENPQIFREFDAHKFIFRQFVEKCVEISIQNNFKIVDEWCRMPIVINFMIENFEMAIENSCNLKMVYIQRCGLLTRQVISLS